VRRSQRCPTGRIAAPDRSRGPATLARGSQAPQIHQQDLHYRTARVGRGGAGDLSWSCEQLGTLLAITKEMIKEQALIPFEEHTSEWNGDGGKRRCRDQTLMKGVRWGRVEDEEGGRTRDPSGLVWVPRAHFHITPSIAPSVSTCRGGHCGVFLRRPARSFFCPFARKRFKRWRNVARNGSHVSSGYSCTGLPMERCTLHQPPTLCLPFQKWRRAVSILAAHALSPRMGTGAPQQQRSSAHARA
jgi:hypothetical protein